MGIFGTQCPRMIYHEGLGDQVTFDFDHARVLEYTPQSKYVDLVSEITGEREMILQGTDWEVRILVHLFKETLPDYWTALKAYKGKVVTLYLHKDGSDPFVASTHDDSTGFILQEIAPFFLETILWRDAAILTFALSSSIIGVVGENPYIPPAIGASSDTFVVR